MQRGSHLKRRHRAGEDFSAASTLQEDSGCAIRTSRVWNYFMDRELGLIRVRIQTWFPLQIQVYVNEHEWLARKLTRRCIHYTREENAFLAVDDLGRAQTLSRLQLVKGHNQKIFGKLQVQRRTEEAVAHALRVGAVVAKPQEYLRSQ